MSTLIKEKPKQLLKHVEILTVMYLIVSNRERTQSGLGSATSKTIISEVNRSRLCIVLQNVIVKSTIYISR